MTYDDTWRALMNAENINTQLNKAFRLSSDGVNTLTLESDYIPQFSACAEMIRDYAKEAEHNDGFTYWRTTGRTVVTWANGSITYLVRKEVYTYSVEVIDLGYDESLPF